MTPLARRLAAALALLLLCPVAPAAAETAASDAPALTAQATPPGAYDSPMDRYPGVPGGYGTGDLPPDSAAYGDQDRYGYWDRGPSPSMAYDEPWGYRGATPYADSGYGTAGGQGGAAYWGPEAGRLPGARPYGTSDPASSGYPWAERYPATSPPPMPRQGAAVQGGPGLFAPAEDYGWPSTAGATTGFAGAGGWSEAQARQVRRILRQARRAQHEFQGQMIAAQDALEEVLEVGRPEPEAVGDAYARIFDVQRRMIVERVRTANEIAAVLDEAGPSEEVQPAVEDEPDTADSGSAGEPAQAPEDAAAP